MHVDEIPLYMYSTGKYERLVWTRYQNANGYCAAIVARITLTSEGTQDPRGPYHILDWSAYMGGSDRSQSEIDAILHIAEDTGNKISFNDAKYFFGDDLPMGRYRE
jgi:hypothetical protein